MVLELLISMLSVTSPVGDTLLLQPATISALKESVLQDNIPSPVSFIDMEDLERDGTYRPNSLSGRVPGLHIPEYGASLTSTIYMRGLGSRMENPVVGLYLDGIPVLDKNAYDFDWEGVCSVTVLRGPQGTLYGRNTMGGVLSVQTVSPTNDYGLTASLEGGNAGLFRIRAAATLGDHALSATYRHLNGFFPNVLKNKLCDPYDGLSAHWKWERTLGDRLFLRNTLWVNLSSEGGFAYGQWKSGAVQPVSYNDEGSYRRLSVIEGLSANWRNDAYVVDATASIQILADDMRMDQDYTSASVFTLRQRQFNSAGTLELRFRRSDSKAAWQPQTGVFALYKLNHLTAPVTFKRDGIVRLILDNANSHIPADIGYLSIPDEEIPIHSDFNIGTWNIAVFHESVFSAGDWQFTAGLRLDYEGGMMDYDCLASLHYRFVPTMSAEKPFSVPYTGRERHASWEILPKLSALYKATSSLSLYTTLSKGYRAGGFNTQIFSDILQNKTMDGLMKDLGVYLDRPIVSVSADDTEYDPETAWNFEIGARLNKGELHAELSTYYIAVQNQQLTVFPPGMSTGRKMTNAGRSRSTGVETEISWTPGDFRGIISWSWCDARFLSYQDGNHDYSGLFIPYVPRHTLFFGAGYSFHPGACRVDTDLSVRGAGPLYWNEDNSLKEPFRLRLGARVALVFPKWEFYVRGENLADTPGHSFYFKSVGNEFFAGVKPRTLLAGITIKL